jgi:hypothetical protein
LPKASAVVVAGVAVEKTARGATVPTAETRPLTLILMRLSDQAEAEVEAEQTAEAERLVLPEQW